MTPLPVLAGERLRLRPFDISDGPQVRRLAGDRRIADTTVNIPHPYEPGQAEGWIATHGAEWATGRQANFAVTRHRDGALIGAVGLVLEPAARRADLGFWIGVPHWRRGYCTEACRAVLGYVFADLAFNRVTACHFSRNPASGRVMQKLGMIYEGRLRSHVLKWDRYEDLELYGILAGEWPAASGR